MNKSSLSVIIVTYNEEIHIARALDSIAEIASQIFVVDSYSTDHTLKIASKMGAVVLQHEFVNYAKQFQWALDNCSIETDWILRMDADEIIEADLAVRIRDELPNLAIDVVGINIDRKHIFMDKWIRHGGRYPLTLLRIFRRDHGQIEQRWMDEHIIVEGGRTVHFAGGFADHNLNDLSFFTEKHNKYATREAIDIINQRLNLFSREDTVTTQNTSRQAAFKRWVKERIYNHMPFTISTLGYFLYRYIFQLGFLDGREGLIYHFLQGFWYRFLVGAKVQELDKAIRHLDDKASIRKELTRLTGLQIE